MKIIMSLALIMICGAAAVAQEPADASSPRLLITKAECSLNSSFLQSIDADADADDLIIIVSHLGKSEKNKMADRRLSNAQTFLSRFTTKARAPERIIVSKGDDSPGEGFLDFFVKGRLVLRIVFPKNKDLNVQPCVRTPEQKPCAGEDERLYYPCKEKV